MELVITDSALCDVEAPRVRQCHPPTPSKIKPAIAQTLHPRYNAGLECRSVAQPGSALALGARCRRFESFHSDQELLNACSSVKKFVLLLKLTCQQAVSQKK